MPSFIQAQDSLRRNEHVGLAMLPQHLNKIKSLQNRSVLTRWLETDIKKQSLVVVAAVVVLPIAVVVVALHALAAAVVVAIVLVVVFLYLLLMFLLLLS